MGHGWPGSWILWVVYTNGSFGWKDDFPSIEFWWFLCRFRVPMSFFGRVVPIPKEPARGWLVHTSPFWVSFGPEPSPKQSWSSWSLSSLPAKTHHSKPPSPGDVGPTKPLPKKRLILAKSLLLKVCIVILSCIDSKQFKLNFLIQTPHHIRIRQDHIPWDSPTKMSASS